MDNIFQIPQQLPELELFEQILSTPDILIERIISQSHVTPLGEWYDADADEWVILLQGSAQLSYQNGTKLDLKAGDYLLIPAHQQHRVEYTSTNPVCIWLAVHIKPSS